MSAQTPASPFVAQWVARLARAGSRPQRALDVAMGRGRHAHLMARHGFRTFGVDVKASAVREVIESAACDGLAVHGWCADLTVYPLPVNAFDLVVVTRYLQRDLFPSLRAAVRPGGRIVYETFTVKQRALGTGPTSADHLLDPGELRGYFNDWTIRFSEEVESPEAVARIVAEKPPRRPAQAGRYA